MLVVGHLLGPGDPKAALEAAKVGAKVPRAASTSDTLIVYLGWPVGGARRRPVRAARPRAPEPRSGRRASSPTRARRESPRSRAPRLGCPAHVVTTSASRADASTRGKRHVHDDPVRPARVPRPGQPRPRRPEPAARRGRRAPPSSRGAAVAVVAAVGVRWLRRWSSSCRWQLAGDRGARDALGYVSLDLDPSASQKIEAIKILRKFPALKKRAAHRQPRRPARAVFDADREESATARGSTTPRTCSPGSASGSRWPPYRTRRRWRRRCSCSRSATRSRPGPGSPSWRSAAPGRTRPAGLAFVGDYLLVAETQKKADAMAADAESSALADDADLPDVDGPRGRPGHPHDVRRAGGCRGRSSTRRGGWPARARRWATRPRPSRWRRASRARRAWSASPAVPSRSSSPTAGLPAVSVRSPARGPTSRRCPAARQSRSPWRSGTAGWTTCSSRVRSGGGGDTLEKMFAQGERDTGLALPEDLEKLLGSGVTVSVDGSADVAALATAPDPTTVPAGVRITGTRPDHPGPRPAQAGRRAGCRPVLVRSGDGVVAVGADPDYLDPCWPRATSARCRRSATWSRGPTAPPGCST